MQRRASLSGAPLQEFVAKIVENASRETETQDLSETAELGAQWLRGVALSQIEMKSRLDALAVADTHLPGDRQSREYIYD